MFTEQRFGAEAVERVLGALSAADRQILEGAALVGWYPVEPVMAYHHKLDQLYGHGDLDLCVEVGKFSAEWALNTVLKFFVRFRTPHWLMERSASLWGRYHDSGRWEILNDPNVPLLARLHGFEVRDPAFCARFRGWLIRAVELTGAKEPRVVEPACSCRGQAYCEYQVRWR